MILLLLAEVFFSVLSSLPCLSVWFSLFFALHSFDSHSIMRINSRTFPFPFFLLLRTLIFFSRFSSSTRLPTPAVTLLFLTFLAALTSKIFFYLGSTFFQPTFIVLDCNRRCNVARSTSPRRKGPAKMAVSVRAYKTKTSFSSDSCSGSKVVWGAWPPLAASFPKRFARMPRVDLLRAAFLIVFCSSWSISPLSRCCLILDEK